MSQNLNVTRKKDLRVLTNCKLHVSHQGNMATTTAGKQTNPNLVLPASGKGQCPHHNRPHISLGSSADVSSIGPLYQEGLWQTKRCICRNMVSPTEVWEMTEGIACVWPGGPTVRENTTAIFKCWRNDLCETRWKLQGSRKSFLQGKLLHKGMGRPPSLGKRYHFLRDAAEENCAETRLDCQETTLDFEFHPLSNQEFYSWSPHSPGGQDLGVRALDSEKAGFESWIGKSYCTL